MPTTSDVVALARSMLGTPYHHQGRLPGVGLDCAGVPIVIGRQLGIVAPDFDVTAYPRVPDGVSLQRYCDEHLVRVGSLKVGGVALVAFQAGPPQHMGVVIPYWHGGDALAMVHAESLRHRKVIETRLLFGRSMRLVGAYAFPGVD